MFISSIVLYYLKIINMKKNFFIGITTFILVVLIPPAHAYAGPGVAIGAIIVAITVILAFFSSLAIRIFNLTKNIFYILKKKIFSNSKFSKKNKSNKNK